MPSTSSFVFSSEILNSDIKSCFDGVAFQDTVWEECFSICLQCLYLQCFCYCFYEGFIPKIVLVSGFLLFICISYLLKVFKFDTGILPDSCVVLLLKTLSRLPQSIDLYVLFYFCLLLFPLLLVCSNDLLSVNRSAAEFVAPLDSAVPSISFEQINVFWTQKYEKYPWTVFLAFD